MLVNESSRRGWFGLITSFDSSYVGFDFYFGSFSFGLVG